VDPLVKLSAIDVSAKDGVLLLQGTVADDATRMRALDIARTTEGVVQVVDRISINKNL